MLNQIERNIRNEGTVLTIKKNKKCASLHREANLRLEHACGNNSVSIISVTQCHAFTKDKGLAHFS